MEEKAIQIDLTFEHKTYNLWSNIKCVVIKIQNWTFVESENAN